MTPSFCDAQRSTAHTLLDLLFFIHGSANMVADVGETEAVGAEHDVVGSDTERRAVCLATNDRQLKTWYGIGTLK